MITALFLKNYKIFKNINFIPVSNDLVNPLSVYIGKNSVGKSSVLESLDVYFNNSRWNITKGISDKNDSIVVPIFLIEKEKLIKSISDNNSKLELNNINLMSNYFWDFDPKETESPNLKGEEFEKFYEYKEELKSIYNHNEYYLLFNGLNITQKNTCSTFDSQLSDLITNYDDFLKEVYNLLVEMYTYLYIPAESLTKDILEINNINIQKVMSKKVLEGIDEILTDKKIDVEGKKSKRSIIELLNNNLSEYMGDVNKIIKNIDKDYEYKVEKGKKHLSSNDVRESIINSYFSIRTLKKGAKELYELSSSEQRIAIIDVFISFLTEDSTKEKEIILAIDEPEISLHINKVFEQFHRLINLSYVHQILLSTHWYGILPFNHLGNTHLIELINKEHEITSFEKNLYLSNKHIISNELEMKSYFDLSTSIYSSLRNGLNWIICEGYSDKLYIDYYLPKSNNIKVLSLGGCGNVIKLYNHLAIPLNSEKKQPEGKVICLIDTDDNIMMPEFIVDKEKHIKLYRLDIKNDNRVKEIKSYREPRELTEIEDLLNPKQLFHSIESVFIEQGLLNIGEISFNDETENSQIKSEFESIIISEPKFKKIVYEEIDKGYMKAKIAKKYIEKQSKEVPIFFEWLKGQVDLSDSEKKEISNENEGYVTLAMYNNSPETYNIKSDQILVLNEDLTIKDKELKPKKLFETIVTELLNQFKDEEIESVIEKIKLNEMIPNKVSKEIKINSYSTEKPSAYYLSINYKNKYSIPIYYNNSTYKGLKLLTNFIEILSDDFYFERILLKLDN